MCAHILTHTQMEVEREREREGRTDRQGVRGMVFSRIFGYKFKLVSVFQF